MKYDRPPPSVQEDRKANQRRGDMRMSNNIFAMVGVTGETLARAMPRALEINIREALGMLDEENKLMVDGPNLGLKGVTVYEIVTDEMVPQGEGGSKSGKRHAVRPLVRRGPQRTIYGENCTVEWGKQKRGTVRRGTGSTEGEGGGSGSAEAATKVSISGGAEGGGAEEGEKGECTCRYVEGRVAGRPRKLGVGRCRFLEGGVKALMTVRGEECRYRERGEEWGCVEG